MSKKEFAVIIILGFLAIIQVSFVPHFGIDAVPGFKWLNLISLAVFVVAVFEHRRGRLSWAAALWGGIFLDLYSGYGFFGFWILSLAGIVAAVKLILKKYVRIPSFW